MNLFDLFEVVQELIDRGGPVLWAILVVLAGVWAIILERYAFIYLVFPKRAQAKLKQWQICRDPESWSAHRLREALVSQAGLELRRGMPALKTLIALCPLLGLLGTVTGMIHVFDVVTVMGTGNARAMAAGVSRATIPTLAGMVAALSGLYLQFNLEQRIGERQERLLDRMRPHRGQATQK